MIKKAKQPTQSINVKIKTLNKIQKNPLKKDEEKLTIRMGVIIIIMFKMKSRG